MISPARTAQDSACRNEQGVDTPRRIGVVVSTVIAHLKEVPVVSILEKDLCIHPLIRQISDQ